MIAAQTRDRGPWLWFTLEGGWEVYALRPDVSTPGELRWLRVPCASAEGALFTLRRLSERA